MTTTKLALLLALATSTAASAAPTATGYAPAKGVSVYYEVHGTGDPLVLLHGGLTSLEVFGDNLTELAKHHKVIAIDLQGHGRTSLGTRPMSLEAMADDVVAVLDKLQIDKADVMGYSLGGEVSIAFAARHPKRAKRLVIVSAPFKRDGWHKEMLDGMNQITSASAKPMKQSPLYAMFYAKLAPKVDEWPRFVGAVGDLLRKPYDFSAQVPSFPPTLIVVGDADGVQLTHAVAFFRLLGGGKTDAGWDGKARPASQLAILPNHTHYVMGGSPVLVQTVEPFLGR